MSEPSIGQCFTLGLLKETGVVYDSSCMVDVLDTAIHVVFVFIFGIWIVYLNRKESSPDRNGFYHKHHIGRWLLSSGIVLASIAAFMEGILTASTGQYHLKNVSHLFIPFLLVLCSVLLSLWFSCEMDREYPRQGNSTVMVYCFCALCGQLLRIGHLVPSNGVTILTARIGISVIIVAFYTGLAVVELNEIFKIKSKPKESFQRSSVFDNESSTMLSRLTYHWMRDVFSYYKSTDIEDIVEELGPMPLQYQVNYIQKIWLHQWRTEKEDASKESRRASLWRIIIKIIGKNQLKAASLKLTADLLSYLGPVILAGTVHYTMQPNCADMQCRYENIGFHYITVQEYFQNGFVLMYCLFVTYVINFILNETHLFWTSIQGLQAQAGLQALIYQKTLRLWGTGNGQDHIAVGRLMNLASVDAKCIYVSYTWCEVWAAPLRLMITFGILIQAYGMSAFVALVLLIMLVPLQLLCGFFISSFQRQKKKHADARTRVSNELFQSIKTIKALAWEDLFCGKISDTRRQELKPLFKQLMVLSFILCISSCLPLFVTATILGLYSKFSGIPLTPARAFFAVSLLNQLVAPLTDFSVYMNILVNAKVSINRILRFLESPEISAGDKSIPDEEDTAGGDPWNDVNVSEQTPLMNVKTKTSLKGNSFVPTEEYVEDADTVFKIRNGCFCTFDKKLLLRNVNVTIPRGGLTLLMGPVGSGKSSLLLALLEELSMASGNYRGRYNLSSVAYCCQKGGILNASLKENILFGRAYNENRYRTVIDACCLRPDINILPAQDETEIGERGINLSGGQRQRLSLARALYSDKETLLLDDPLSSLDVHVKRAVFQKAVGMLRSEGRTVLLVVNDTANCEQADHIIMMKNGTVKDEGSPQELIDRGVLSIRQSDHSGRSEDTDMEQQIELERINLKILLQKEFTKDSREMLTEKEDYDAGDVSWRVYSFYFRACSTVIVLLTLSSLTIRAIFCLSTDLWLAAWSEAGISNTTNADNSSLSYYLTGYLSLGSMVALVTVVGCVLLKTGSLNGAQRVHEAMLIRVVQAPARFFDVNPLGRLLNRFTSDVNTADIRMDGTVTMVQYAMISVITAVVANTIVVPPFLLLTVPLAMLFFLLFRKYLSLSMKLQRAANVSRSPVLSFLAESVNTVTTVRAYRDQCRFYNTYIDRLERYTAVSFYLTAVQRWLAIRLDLLGTVAMLIAGIAALISTLYFNSPVSYVGVSLAYSLQISYFLGQWVRSVSRLELCMNSIERIKSYCEIKTERYNGFLPEDDWPRNGSVRFHNVHVRYASHLDAVLTNININISGGQKVGICGRTGSGKSTLALTFLRFVDIFKGFVAIDGVDIKSVPLKVLRQRVAIIQQEAVLFSGTIRFNLDPYNVHKDEELWRILDQVHMRDSIPMKTGLNTMVKDIGSNFSAGQRQLLCLARALLRNTKILVMDEATATVDEETNRLVESIVENEFRDKTVFTIVHRLESIMNYDVILVLDSSRIVEVGSPNVLLRSPDGIFKSMVQKQK